MPKNLSKSLEVLFSNNINIKIYINLLFNDFGGNCIIFLFTLSLGNCDRLDL